MDCISDNLVCAQQWGEKEFFRLEVVEYDFDKDILFFKIHYASLGVSYKTHFTYAIPLAEINPERIRPVKLMIEDGFGIELLANYGRESIGYTSRYYDTGKLGKEGVTNFLTIPIPMSVYKKEGERELLERIITAFRHLIKLAGGQGEKF